MLEPIKKAMNIVSTPVI